MVKGLAETEWHASSNPEGRQAIAEWRSWRGPDGAAAGRMCALRLASKHKAKDHLEQDRRGQLIAGEVLIKTGNSASA